MNSSVVLVRKLSALGATTRPPATAQKIVEVEHRLGVTFPEGVKDFYRACDGLGDATKDWIWDFFCLERVVERTIERRKVEHLIIDDGLALSYRDLVCFCDVLVDAPTYLFFAKTTDGKFGHFYADQGGGGWHVADSFEGFVAVFLADNDEILLNAG